MCTGFKDFSIALYVSAGCSLVAAEVILQLDVNVKNSKKSIIQAARTTVKMIDVDIFFLVQIMVGSCWGLHMNLFSFYVDIDLKASKSLFGIAISQMAYALIFDFLNNFFPCYFEGGALCISGIGSVIMFWLAKIIVAKFGEANSMAFGLLSYCARFLVYYFLE